jgi:glycosyltransferase involved in cell wall biosynthesis
LDRSRQNFFKKRQYFTALPNLTLVPISTWMSEKLSFSFLKEQKRQTIINGIDLSCFRPYDKKNVRAELGICEEDFVVFAAASTWTDDKGLQEIVRLSKNPDFKLVVLGVQSSQAKLFSNNTFTRPLVLDKSLLAKYYAAADVFVNPTYNDSFSNVNMESLACGTPVVCYRSGGAPDTLSSQTGIVVPRGDYEALEKAIYLIRNKEFVVTEGDCRKWVEANFDKDKNFEQYIQLYLSLLS